MGRDAARDRLRAARASAPVRLSRLLQVRLLDQRQAERAGTWIPRALAAGAEIRDLAMVGQIEIGADGLARPASSIIATGEWRLQRARNVVVAGYAIETPRLLLNSACAQYPDGLANSSGLVGKYFMAHANHAVWGVMQDEIRWYKGPPSMAV